jgi:hypothetical protein
MQNITETYRKCSYRSDGRKNENNADEQCPETSPCINKLAEDAHMPRSRLKLSKQKFTNDGNAIAPVKCNGADIENARNGSV